MSDIIHNEGAEEGVIGACLVDLSGEFLAKLLDSGCAPDWFHNGRCRVIWDAITAVHDSGDPVDDITVCQSLATRGQLEMAGGLVEVNRIGNAVQSTVNAGAWLETLKVCAYSRRLAHASRVMVERLKNGRDLPSVLSSHEEAVAAIADAVQSTGEKKQSTASKRSAAKVIREAETYRFDLANPPIRRQPIIKLVGKPICKKGDLLAFIAPNKTGKSSSLAAMMGSTFGVPDRDFLGFESSNPNGEEVLHLMTEESVEDHWDMVYRTARRAAVSEIPPWFGSYHLRRFPTEKRRLFFFGKARELHAKNPVRLIILDGVADFVTDVNDLKECKAFVDELLALMDELDCAIAVTIHVNPSLKPSERDKAKGHLGTLLEQKASTILLLKKEFVQGVEHITINTKDARHGTVKEPPTFAWSDEAKMHVTVSKGDGFTAIPSLAEKRVNGKVEDLRMVAKDAIGKAKALPYLALVQGIEQARGVSDKTAQRRIKEMLSMKVVDRDENTGFYRLCGNDETLDCNLN